VRIFLIILSFFFAAQNSFAQQASSSSYKDSSFTLVRTYNGDITDAAMDNLGNLYIISSTGQIKKFNGAGDSVAIYNQVRNSGKVFTLDVSNPLKVLLFYKDFSSVVVLDRFLTNITTIDLKKFTILQPVAIGLSYDNNIWVYDEYDNKLKKINEQGNILLETIDFRQVFNQSITPQKIINDNGLVYLADTASGIFVFDNYGAFKKKIPLLNWQSIAINKTNIISTTNEMISVYNSSTLLQTQRKNPFFNPYVHSFISADKFVNFSSQELQIYQYRY
jgi:hypothetical protein